MKIIVFDIETDGLLDKVSKLHCLSYQIIHKGKALKKKSLTSKEDIENFFNSYYRDHYFAGHWIIGYDIPALKKLGFNIPELKYIDTLALSWYLYPYRPNHGLEVWGENLGFPKPEVEDWENLSLETYIQRCEADVEINSRLLNLLLEYLFALYDNNLSDMFKQIEYLNEKFKVLADQERFKITLDVERTKEILIELEEEFKRKENLLSEAMPKELGTLIKSKPKRIFRKDGSLTKYGSDWIDLLEKLSLPFHTEEIRDKPNPGSNTQLKKWLYSLGWNPATWEESKATGLPVEKINLPFGQGICPSVKLLEEKEPVIEELDNFFKLRHRISIFKGYLESVNEEGQIFASAQGFTNTLRLKHRSPIVNLPKPEVYYGKEIREVLTIPKNGEYIMIGADISGLEDNTKQHFIYPHDPEYVEEMRVPGFDPHIDIGTLSNLISKEEAEEFKRIKNLENPSEKEIKILKDISKKRGISKNCNFALTYNAFPPKVSSVAGIPIETAENIFEVYWNRNWAIKKVAEDCEVKVIKTIDFIRIKGSQKYQRVETFVKWLKSPLSGQYLYLKHDKDRFSTLNQNAGVFVFDNWVKEIRKRLKEYSLSISLQMHDEIMIICKKKDAERIKEILFEAMEEVNRLLKLNVEITISAEIGKNYAEVH